MAHSWTSDSDDDPYEVMTQTSIPKYKLQDQAHLNHTYENVQGVPGGKSEISRNGTRQDSSDEDAYEIMTEADPNLPNAGDSEGEDYTQIDDSHIVEYTEDDYVVLSEVNKDNKSDENKTDTIGSSDTPSLSLSNPLYPLTHDKQFDVPHTFCVGISILDDGHVIVVSQDGHIIVYSASCEYLSLAEFPYIFNDVTSIPKKGFATTSGYCINFFTLKNDQVVEQEDKCIDRQFTTETTFHGLVCSRDKLIVSCNVQSVRDSCIKPFISVLNMTGKVLSKISNDCLVMPTNVECSHDGHLILVLDTGCNSVVCFNHAGKIIWRASFSDEPSYLVTQKKTLAIALPSRISLFCIASGKPHIKEDENLRDEKVILAYKGVDEEIVLCPQTMTIPPNCRLTSVKVKEGKSSVMKRLLSFS